MINSSFYRPASTDGDLLDWVDENDRVRGTLTRAEIHSRGLIHRAINIAVFDSRDRLWLQHRHPGKDAFGGWWDLSCTGHVDAGEEYDEAAVREIKEELGVAVTAAPRRVLKFRPCVGGGWEFHMLYWLRGEGPFDFDPSEIVGMRALSLKELHEAIRNPTDALKLTPGVTTALPHLIRAMGLDAGGVTFEESGREYEMKSES